MTPEAHQTSTCETTNANTNTNATHQEEDHYLNTTYDVIIYGTGLTQSILASALCRAGKSVLHCDSNAFYGELDAVMNLNDLQSWASQWRESGSNDSEPGLNEPMTEGGKASSIPLNPHGTFSSLRIHSMTIQTSSGTLESCSSQLSSSDVLKVDQAVVTPYGQGIVISLPLATTGNESTSSSLEVKLHDWTMANGKSPTAYFGYKPSTSSSTEESKDSPESITKYFALHDKILPLHLFQLQNYILNQQYSRSYAIDLTPSILLAQGKAVDGLVTSGVADYCEFKSLLGSYWLSSNCTEETGRKRRTSRRNVSGGNIADGSASSGVRSRSSREDARQNPSSSISSANHSLSRVPCSKGDVFQTKLFSPLDKRKLMKFLQLASDYAIAMSANDTESSDPEAAATSDSSSLLDEEKEENVTSLNERQLQQGRSLYRPQNKTIATTDLELLQKCIDEDMDFDTYLKTQHKFSEYMRQIVIYAIAMGCFTSAEDTQSNPYSTKHGMTDLCNHVQSLGKFGQTAFLVPMYGSGELSQAFCRSAAVHGGTYLLRHGVTQVVLKNSPKDICAETYDESLSVSGVVLDTSGHYVSSKHIVVPSAALTSQNDGDIPSTFPKGEKRVFRRVSILRGRMVKSDSEQRHIHIIPPSTVGNTNVIYGIAVDNSVNIAPYDYPSDFNTTVLHLTTIVESNEISHQIEADHDVLKRAIQALVASHQEGQESDVEELFHLSFSHAYDSYDINTERTKGNINGLYICAGQRHLIRAETAFEEAKTLFERLCPDCEFLCHSAEMNEILKQRHISRDDDEDQDEMMLKKAMNDLEISTEQSEHD